MHNFRTTLSVIPVDLERHALVLIYISFQIHNLVKRKKYGLEFFLTEYLDVDKLVFSERHLSTFQNSVKLDTFDHQNHAHVAGGHV